MQIICHAKTSGVLSSLLGGFLHKLRTHTQPYPATTAFKAIFGSLHKSKSISCFYQGQLETIYICYRKQGYEPVNLTLNTA